MSIIKRLQRRVGGLAGMFIPQSIKTEIHTRMLIDKSVNDMCHSINRMSRDMMRELDNTQWKERKPYSWEK